MSVSIGVSGQLNGQPATWRPHASLNWSERFGPARTEREALHKAYTKSLPVASYEARVTDGLSNVFFGKRLSRFEAVGTAAHHLPMAIVANDHPWRADRPVNFYVMPTKAIVGGANHDNVGMPKVGDVVRGGYASIDYRGTPHGRIVALLDRSSIARFTGTGETVVNKIGTLQRTAMLYGPHRLAVGAAVAGVTALGVAAGGAYLALRD